MRIFTCEDSFEAMMTCIYDAWEWAAEHGHDNVRLMREPVYQQSLFDEYIHVDADSEKALKVSRSIQNQISKDAYVHVYYASLSHDEGALDAIYRFLLRGFAVGARICFMLTDPYVIPLMELKRKVGNESHFFREFARFDSIDNKIYVCHIEPKDNVVYLVAQHFADRMPSEYWMIIDDNRRLSVVHPADEDMYFRNLSDEEFNILSQTESVDDEYKELWKTFFNAIGIKQRTNYECQRNLMPLWMRKHVTEFM